MFGNARQKISRTTFLLLALLLWWSSQVMSHPAPVTGAVSDAPRLTTPMPLSANGQNRTQAEHLIPLADMLNSDGSVQLEQGLHGSLDPTGWQMVTQQDGTPRFMPNDNQSPPLHELGGGQWDENFGSAGTSDRVRAVAVTTNSLYVAGEFTTAGGTAANYIAQWDGSSWSPLGDGMDSTVYALAVDSNGTLYAGGDFTTAEGTTVNHIASWDGSNWSALGNGMNNTVWALVVDSDDTLYAGGYFTTADGTTVNHIARWDGSNWSALGSGMNGNWVYALAVDSNDTLYAGGHFTTAGGTSANYIASWDGSNWSALGNGMNSTVHALAVDSNDTLYAGGHFTTADDTLARRIARWDGSNWSALGSDNGMNNRVLALAVDSNGTLYAGGDFTTADGTSANRIATWDGSSWSALGSGMNNWVWALAVDSKDNLYAGGEFTTAGGTTANHIAHWIANPTISADNPRANNVRINPSNQQPDSDLFVVPSVGTEISVSYDYDDPNGDPEGETLIRWTRGSQLEQQVQPQLNQERTVPSDMTLAEERWCVIVTPHDGQLYGQPVEACAYIERIPNQLPEVEVTIPEYPGNDEPLTISYQITDTDNQRQNLTAQLRWYRDGILQPTLNNEESVDQELTYIAEEWCAVAQAYDGEDYGPIAEPKCTIINPPDNILPVAQNARILPAAPTNSDDLTLAYMFSDQNDDLENQGLRQIRWYRNGELEPAFNNEPSVGAQFTSPGERWSVALRLYDGLGYGRWFRIKGVYISTDTIYTLPEALGVQITPVEPGNNDPLGLRYTFADADGDEEADTKIYWYKDRVRMTSYDGLSVIPADQTQLGEVWYAVVIPHDGQTYGPPLAANSVTIASETENTAPRALDVYLSPGIPGNDEKLTVRYLYYDKNGDLEGETEIRWTANNIPQKAYNDYAMIPAAATSLNQTWCATVKPHDGQDYGSEVAAESCVTIQAKGRNVPPEARDAYLLPARPVSAENIELFYDYLDFDSDNDSEDDTRIHWFKNGILQKEFDGRLVVWASKTKPGEQWYATILPHDGIEYGSKVTTSAITVNTPPEPPSEPFIMPSEPKDHEDLNLSYIYRDAENDPEINTRIRWYKDGVHQPQWDKQETVPHQATSVDEAWQAEIEAFDGYDYSAPTVSTDPVIILAGATSLYLPLILLQPTPTPTPRPSDTPVPTITATRTATMTPIPIPTATALPYEENDTLETAQLLELDQEYLAYPEDKNDWYYFEINQTSSIEIKVSNYRAGGQLVVYRDDSDKNRPPEWPIVGFDTRERSTMEIPNDVEPNALKNLQPGKYLIRIYTTENNNATHLYRLEVRYE